MRWPLAGVRPPVHPRKLVWACLSLGAVDFGPTASAQEALLGAVEQDQAYQARERAPIIPPDERMHVGPVDFFLTPALSGEWNDNVNLSGTQPEADFIVRPEVGVQAFLPASEHVRLNLVAGVGYAWYVEGHQQNQLLLSPNSNLGVDLPVKNLILTVYDQASYSDQTTPNASLDAGSNDVNVQNTGGLRASWTLDDWLLQAGYGHYNYYSLAQANNYLNRASEQFFGRVGYALAPATRVGLEASGSITTYDQPPRSNFHSVSFGPALEWTITEALHLTARGGYVEYINEPNPLVPPPANVSTYYLGLEARHQLTRSLSQQLGVTRDVQVGTTSDFLEQLTVQYGVQWAFTDVGQLSAGVSYERGQEPQGQFVEDYDRLGFSLGLSYRITERVSSTLAYRYSRRDSNVPGQQYQQNSVTLGASYRF